VAGSVWDEVLDCEGIEVVRTYIERWPRQGRPPEKVLIIVVQPDAAHRCRCPECGTRGKPAEHDVRRWRTLDVHGKRTFIESRVPRISCPEHGKITAAVPWAAHADRFTAVFAQHAAWLAAQMPWTKAARELRVTWDAVESIVARAAADAASRRDRLDGLRRIGIDEKSWGNGEGKYLMVVTDHDRGTIAWIAEGRCQETVGQFFDALGPERSKLLTHVSADGAEWIHDVVREKAPQATICLDAFHVVKWAGERLDELRRRLASELRAAGKGDQAAALGAGMWALRKKPQNLTGNQRTALAVIAADNKQMYKGYLIKEQLREALKIKGKDGRALLAGVTAWAHRCRVPEFAKLAKTLSRFKDLIVATLDGGPSNGRAEALNAQINALITRARGFRSAAALIAMAEFTHGGLCPDSPYSHDPIRTAHRKDPDT
jgi:transposase